MLSLNTSNFISDPKSMKFDILKIEWELLSMLRDRFRTVDLVTSEFLRTFMNFIKTNGQEISTSTVLWSQDLHPSNVF